MKDNADFKGTITKKEYILTNWWVSRGGQFVIRLIDDEEYPVYFRKINNRKIYYIKKEDGNYKLDDEVKKYFIENMKTYIREGI